MRLSEFDYELPAELIAQEALPDRTSSRLMVLGRRTGAIEHAAFSDFVRFLREGDLLVLNDTRVVPARLRARKPTGGLVELLLLEPVGPWDPAPGGTNGAGPRFRCLIDGSRLRPGQKLRVSDAFSIELLDREPEGWIVRLETGGGEHVSDLLERHGEMPLPPYIRRERPDPRAALDRERYQTVYARRPGAVAAPTAGLHFSPAMLETIRGGGTRVAFLTLHVGAGTFLPVRAERVEDHRMHSEAFDLPVETASAVEETRRSGGRVIAVGTTVARTLEARARDDGRVVPGSGRCDLFLFPGARVRAIDALLTNFHLPRSTLLLLVCGFAGRENALRAYREAVRERYRFYSYGDAMLVRPD